MRNLPDPTKAHGAWVFLGLAVLAGVLTATGRGVLPALLAGLAFAGVFLASSGLSLRGSRRIRRVLTGTALAGGAAGSALFSGADPAFLSHALVAIFPAALSGWFALREGVRFQLAWGFAVPALLVAAPSAACAGGVAPLRAWLLALSLFPFFFYRTWVVDRRLRENRGWSRNELRRLGLREALLALLWTLASVGAIHLIP